MKKLFWIIFVLVSVCGILFIIFSFSNMPNVSHGSVNYKVNEQNTTISLSNEDLSFLRKTFNGKFLYKGNLYCGFEESTSVVLGDQIFCIACDGCAKVYWKNQNKYFNLSNREYLALMECLKKYGFVMSV